MAPPRKIRARSDLVPAPERAPALQTEGRRSAVEAWLDSQRSDRTRATYKIHIADWERWAEEHGVDPLRPRRVDLDQYATHLRAAPTRTGRPLTNSTQKAKLSVVSSLLGYLKEEGAITDNPAARMKLPRVATDHAKTPALTDDDAARLLAAAAEHGLNTRVLVAIMLTMGVRISGVVAAHIEHLSTDAGRPILTITLKGGVEQQLVVPTEVMADIRTLIGERTHGPIVTNHAGGPMHRSHAWRLVKRLAATAGVENADRIGNHALRRTVITSMLERGDSIQDVQRIAGHADVRTTMLYHRARNVLRKQEAQVAANAAVMYALIDPNRLTAQDGDRP